MVASLQAKQLIREYALRAISTALQVDNFELSCSSTSGGSVSVG